MSDLTQQNVYADFVEGLLITPAYLQNIVTTIDNSLGEILDAIGGPNFMPAANPVTVTPGNGLSLNIGGAGQIVIAQGRILDYNPMVTIEVAAASSTDRTDFIAIKAQRVAGPTTEASIVRADAAPMIYTPLSATLESGTATVELIGPYTTPPVVVGLVGVGESALGTGVELTATTTTTSVTITSTFTEDARTVNFIVYGMPTGANGVAENLPILVNTPTYQYGETNNGAPTPNPGYDAFCTFIVRANATTINAADITMLFPTLPALSNNLRLSGLIVSGEASAQTLQATDFLLFADGAFFNQNAPNILNLSPGPNNTGGFFFSDAANNAYNTEFPDGGGVTLLRGSLNVAAGNATISGALTFADGATFFQNGQGVGFTLGANGVNGLYFANAQNNAINTSFPDAGGIVLDRGSLEVGNSTYGTSAIIQNSLTVDGTSTFAGMATFGNLSGNVGTFAGVNISTELTVTGATTLANLTVDASATIDGSLSVEAGFTGVNGTFSGSLIVEGVLTVDQLATLNNGLTVNQVVTTLNSGLVVGGQTTLDGPLSAEATTLSSLSVTGAANVTGNVAINVTRIADLSGTSVQLPALPTGTWRVVAYASAGVLNGNINITLSGCSINQESEITNGAASQTQYIDITGEAAGGDAPQATISFVNAGGQTREGTQGLLVIMATRIS